MRQLLDLFKRFHRDDRGVFAVFFALLALVLIATAGAVVDFTSLETARSRAQTALDSAALALQPTISDSGVTATTLKVKAQALVTERIGDSSVTATVNTVTVDTTTGKLFLGASITRPTAFVRMVGISSLSSNLIAEVTRGSKDIEVSVALDTTGSMAGQKLIDLKNAMNGTTSPYTQGLIEQLVQTAQTPTYSKMAIIPWSEAVNLGTYADNVRGAVTGPTTITGASWISSGPFTISAITKANPAVVTTSATNGFVAGDYVYISNVSGMTNLNNNIYKVGTVTAATKKFQLLNTNGTNVNSSSWTAFSTSGTPKVSKCFGVSCQVRVTTSSAHGHAVGDTIVISGVSGMTALNGTHPSGIANVPSTTTYDLADEDADSVLYTTFSGTGSSYCTKYGCTYYYFTNASGSKLLYIVNTCVTERTTNPFTDDAPSTTKLSYEYPDATGSDCEAQVVQPLTSNKTTLKNLVTSLTAANSTAGHLGLAWGWYMISPKFAYLWPSASQPAAYGKANLVKAVILMTDGQFNMQYCNGVLSDDSDQGSNATQINCNAPNGSSHDQAVALCNAIKAPANSTILYTVGFDLGTDTDSLNFLRDCASSPATFFRADTGADLTSAFQSIAQNLNELRLSK